MGWKAYTCFRCRFHDLQYVFLPPVMEGDINWSIRLYD